MALVKKENEGFRFWICFGLCVYALPFIHELGHILLTVKNLDLVFVKTHPQTALSGCLSVILIVLNILKGLGFLVRYAVGDPAIVLTYFKIMLLYILLINW